MEFLFEYSTWYLSGSLCLPVTYQAEHKKRNSVSTIKLPCIILFDKNILMTTFLSISENLPKILQKQEP